MFVIFGVLGWARSWQVDVIDCQTTKDRKFNLHLIAGRYSSVVLQIVPVLGCSAATKHPDVRGGRPNPIGRLFVGGLLSPREKVCDLPARVCVRCRCVGVCWAVVARWFGRSSSGLRPGRSCVLKSSREILSSLVRCHSGFSVGPFPRPVRKKPCLAALPHLTGVSRAVRLASNILT